VNDELIAKDVEGGSRSSFKVLSQHMPGGTGGNHEKP
jgi:hypothetical protein